MKSEDRIIELLTELIQGQDKTHGRLDNVESRLTSVESRLDGVENQVAKLNVNMQENNRAILKLAEKSDVTDGRLDKLEKHVFKS